MRQSSKDPSPTIGSIVREFTTKFESAGLDSPRLDARVLVAHVMGLEADCLFAQYEDTVDITIKRAADKLAGRRLAHEPVSRIVGVRDFWGLEFELSPETLDPRPDTETLVSAALELKPYFNGAPVSVLDLGTGTGCILLSILSEWPAAKGLGVDISEGAMMVAAENAENLGFAHRAKFVTGNWADGLTEMFDIVVSNPPYIAECERSSLEAEVADFDPPIAIYAGVDGLRAYREMFPSARRVTKPSGRIIIEIGSEQAPSVRRLLPMAGFAVEAEKRDLAQVMRCIVARPI